MSPEYEFECGLRDSDICFLRRPQDMIDLLNQMERSHCDEKTCPIMENRRLLLKIIKLIGINDDKEEA